VLGVALSAVGHQLDQRDALSAAGPVHGFLRHLVRRHDIVPVSAHTGNSVPDRLVLEAGAGGLPLRRRGVGVPVVFDDDDQWTALHCSEVDAFMKGTGGGGTITHVHQADSIFPAQLERQSHAGHDRHHVTQVRYLPDESANRIPKMDVELTAAGGRISLGHVLPQNLERRSSLHEHGSEISDEGREHITLGPVQCVR
jgi:hypothetical protein